MYTKQEDIESLATNFYTSLFTAQEETDPEAVFCHVPVRVSGEMNDAFCKPYSEEEVKKASFFYGCE